MDKHEFDRMNSTVISEFRATGGKASGVFSGKPPGRGELHCCATASAWFYGGDSLGFPGYSLRITFER
jgi:hypothetical protein